MGNLRPISLCSVIYKVISKIMVRRLQPFLPSIVSDSQTAFVSERLISDNILVAHEIVHSLNTVSSISSEFMAVKSDMSKAYDRVEWSYLRSLLYALGFHERWINWVMICVSRVTYSILINDQPYGMVIPQRGLRQGDPLSPFLFVLCTEGLTHLLNMAQQKGSINGIQFNDAGPVVHHLLFADDSLFMCKAEISQCQALQNILKAYGDVTGQMINLAKSSISFGAKVKTDVKLRIQSTMGIFSEGGAGSYLGLPECFSGSKVQMLNYIKDKLKTKMSGWFSRYLSMGGKEVMLKSVAMAMLIFAMSCFKLPKTTCDNLASAMADFWWNSCEYSKKIHWLSWEKMCLPKEYGGIGFRDIQLFNQALLAKQAWRIIQFPNCLFSKFMKARYFSDSEFLNASLSSRPSFAWRSIIYGRELLSKGLIKRVGNGASLRVWTDSWLEDGNMRAPWIKNSLTNVDLWVKDLIDVNLRDWDVRKLEENFFPDDIRKITAIKPLVNTDDYWVWKYNKSGNFSVKSAYWLACQIGKADLIREATIQPSVNVLKEQVWKLHTNPKIKVFLWKVLCGALPVANQLERRGMKVDIRCQSCGFEEESINHVLFACPASRIIWALSDFPSPQNGFDKGSVFSNIHHLLSNRDNLKWPVKLRKSFPWIIWRIWKNRNLLFFEGKTFSASEAVQKIRDDFDEWEVAQAVQSHEEMNRNENGKNQSCISNVFADVTGSKTKNWNPPPPKWLKCNIGIAWSKRNNLAGAAWVLRDGGGKVLMHSRTAFTNIFKKDEAQITGVLWAIDAMISLKYDKLILALEDPCLIGGVLRPQAWPSFRPQAFVLSSALKKLQNWKLELEKSSANRGAALIAQSVTSDCMLQSYVASGQPFWLNKLFDDERVQASY